MPAQTSRANRTTRTLAAIGVGAMALYTSRVLLDFFGPAIAYSMATADQFALDSPEFIQFLSLVTDGTVRHSRITRLRNGSNFYPAFLNAIEGAQTAINLEFYEFKSGRIGDRIVSALTARAKAGVQVRVIVDALGSFSTPRNYFDQLKAAGGQMHWYHPVRWNTWQQANNRTHRKLLVIDGHTGFIGGAGIADRWLYNTRSFAKSDIPTWRDTVFCVEGEAVAGLISTFSENWLESSGEILSGHAEFAFHTCPEGATSFVVSSTPRGGGTQARILFQALLKSAQKSICITTPYFLPDRSARRALIEAIERGVSVRILTAGPKIDHPAIRRLSRRSSLQLLASGAEIYEYQPSMIHAKLMTIDSLWNVVGSTNFDHRSFALNDEVNLAALDRELAKVIEDDFADDLQQSRLLSVGELQERRLLSHVEDLVDHVAKRES